jgi:vanillate O-demethylase monooxygenase subunit
MHLRNAALGDEEASVQMDALFRVAFNEDKEILQAIDEAEQQPQSRRPIRLAIDKGPVVYRQRIAALVAQEQA